MEEDLQHYGIKGQKWGVRRFQNPDGSLTPAGIKRYRKLIGEYNFHHHTTTDKDGKVRLTSYGEGLVRVRKREKTQEQKRKRKKIIKGGITVATTAATIAAAAGVTVGSIAAVASSKGKNTAKKNSNVNYKEVESYLNSIGVSTTKINRTHINRAEDYWKR